MDTFYSWKQYSNGYYEESYWDENGNYNKSNNRNEYWEVDSNSKEYKKMKDDQIDEYYLIGRDGIEFGNNSQGD